MSEPDLSVVLVGRNDGYGGDFVGRVQTCIKALAAGQALTGVAVEVVLVDWNPPDDRPPLGELVPEERPSRVRVVTVPPDLHRSLENPGGLPLFEYLGKNVGVRRASAPAVLVVNPDIVVFPSVLTLAGYPLLSEQVFVRMDRHDFRPPVPRHLAGVDVFDAALGGVFEVHRRPRQEGPGITLMGTDPVDTAQPLHRWARTTPYPYEAEVDGGLFLAGRYEGFTQLHIGMPGDFLLASRDTWAAAGGYWERSDTFTHLDTYFMAQLVGSGACQAVAVAPFLILHEDHPRRTSGMADDWVKVIATCEGFASGNLPLPNPPTWGFADVALPEQVFERATADVA